MLIILDSDYQISSCETLSREVQESSLLVPFWTSILLILKAIKLLFALLEALAAGEDFLFWESKEFESHFMFWVLKVMGLLGIG